MAAVAIRDLVDIFSGRGLPVPLADIAAISVLADTLGVGMDSKGRDVKSATISPAYSIL